MTLWNRDRLERAGKLAGMKQKRDGQWVGRGHSWELRRHLAEDASVFQRNIGVPDRSPAEDT